MPADLVKRINLDQLYLPFAERLLDVLAECRKRGAIYVATSGFRSPEEQMALWQRGRNKDGAVVRPADVVTRVKFGVHNIGGACDVVRDLDASKPGVQVSYQPKDYAVYVEVVESLGLEAGGSWKTFKDYPHAQLPLNKRGVSLLKLRQIYDAEGIPGVWAHLDSKGPW